METCLICGEKYEQLYIHLKKHNIDVKQYCIQYKLMNHKCLGCGKETNFINSVVGFKKYCKTCGKKSQSKDFLIQVYGEEIGISMWTTINEKRKFSNSIEGLAKNHGQEWVCEKMKEFASGANKVKELRKDDNYNGWYLSKQSTNIGYYLNKGMSEEEAKEALTKRQTTFSLEKCIEKHGEEDGRKVWQARQDKWQTILKDKPPEEIERINKLKAIGGTVKCISEIENRFLNLVESFYNIEIERQALMFFDTINSHRSFDGRYKNILIEFQGTYWHCDPRVYMSKYYHPQKERTAEEIWDYDLCKQKLANEIGYKVFVVWENDCKNDIYNEVKRFEEFYESQD